MAEGGADADEEPEYPDYKSWEELYKDYNLNYLIDGLNLYSYKQANIGKKAKEINGKSGTNYNVKSGTNYHITFCNTEKEGKVYIRKEEVRLTIYFILLKNHPKFKGEDKPCKVGFTHHRETDRINTVIENTARKMHRKYNSKEKGVKYEFEVIKLPISATSTEAFEMTEETIRKKSGMEIEISFRFIKVLIPLIIIF